jgi:hypothetical protein
MALQPKQCPEYVKYSHLPNVYKVISCYAGWITYYDYTVGGPISVPYTHQYLIEATKEQFYPKKPDENLGNPT